MKNFEKKRARELEKHNQIKNAVEKSVNFLDRYIDAQLAMGKAHEDIMRDISTMKSSADTDVKRDVLRNKLRKVKNA